MWKTSRGDEAREALRVGLQGGGRCYMSIAWGTWHAGDAADRANDWSADGNRLPKM